MALGRVFPNEIDRLFNAPGGPIGKEARALALDIAREAEILARIKLGRNPKDKPRTGRYARGWRVKVIGRSTAFEVSNREDYSGLIEVGSRPHTIRARRVKMLHFKDRAGRWRTVKSVRHPGTPAFRILEEAAELAIRRRIGSVRVS